MNKYQILPLNFERFGQSTLLTNDAGEYLFVETDKFEEFIQHKLECNDSLYYDLKSKHFLCDNDKGLTQAIDMLATKYRTRKSFLSNFTSLHMMVVTLRCNQKCEYCQVSCEDSESYKYDMPQATAEKIVEYIFKSPSPNIKIEFQGGEPLLNWNAIVSTVNKANKLNTKHNKNLEYVLCTNLTLIDEEKLKFLKENNVYVSSSLDGPQDIHDFSRKLRTGGGTYHTYIEKLKLTRDILGFDKVSALMTTTSFSLNILNRVVEEYKTQGFDGIFLRALNPYGFAAENANSLGYNMHEFIDNYVDILNYIINLNISGTHFVEYYTSLLTSRIFTPFSTGFVDLQSPSGAGISGAIYDYNGDVYPADEARMLARMGDEYFKMGNVFQDEYNAIFHGKVMKEVVSKSCLEILPGCSECVFKPFCGADPVRNYLEHRDIIGSRVNSPFCIKHKGMFKHIFSLINSNNKDILDVLWAWTTNRTLKEVQIENH